MKLQRRLVNVPQPDFYEAGSCWLSRVALSQGASPGELLEFFGLPRQSDLDRRLHGERLARLRSVCGLPDALSLHERIITSLNSMSPVGDGYLARTDSHRPRFRYCPICLKEMRTPHFPIHWRFIAWRWCPIHDCLLEDACPKCGAVITFPFDIAESNAGRQGYAMLNRCQSCGACLTDVEPCHLQVDSFRRVSEIEELLLTNGRALLAALYYGWFQIQGRPGRRALPRFKEIERAGVLPVRLNWLEPAKVRLRAPVPDQPEPQRWGSQSRST